MVHSAGYPVDGRQGVEVVSRAPLSFLYVCSFVSITLILAFHSRLFARIFVQNCTRSFLNSPDAVGRKIYLINSLMAVHLQHLESLDKQVKVAKDMGAELINVHGGRDAWDVAESVCFLWGKSTL